MAQKIRTLIVEDKDTVPAGPKRLAVRLIGENGLALVAARPRYEVTLLEDEIEEEAPSLKPPPPPPPQQLTPPPPPSSLVPPPRFSAQARRDLIGMGLLRPENNIPAPRPKMQPTPQLDARPRTRPPSQTRRPLGYHDLRLQTGFVPLFGQPVVQAQNTGKFEGRGPSRPAFSATAQLAASVGAGRGGPAGPAGGPGK